MTRITLERLVLENFKGVRSLTLDARGGDVDIYGDNGAGKTTALDAFTWVLFNRDSLNQANFEIKTLTTTGEARHNLTHAVEATLLVDGEPLALRKAYSEKWTKKRGSSASEFAGHTTDHFIDGVPVQKKEYDQRVSDLIDEGLFRLITDPTYFNGPFKWQDRRALLLDVCGDVTDEDVVASTEELAELPGILGKRTLDEHRKVVHAKRKEINDELQRIPVRIDEATRSMPDAPAESAEAIEGSLGEARAHLAELGEERARILAGGQAAEAQAKIREIEARLHDAMRAVTARVDGQIDDLREQRHAVATKLDEAEARVSRLVADAKGASTAAHDARQKADALRAEWKSVQGEQPDIHTADTCPVCKQALPAEQVEQAHAEAVAQFNDRKSRRLTEIQERGKAQMAEAEKHDRRRADLDDGIVDAGRDAQALRDKLQEIDANIASLSNQKPDTSSDDAVQALEAEKAEAEAALAALKESTAGSIDAVQARMRDADESIKALEASLVAHRQIAKTQQRIDQLQAQEKELAAEYERLEYELHLADVFTRAKVGMLEERINSKFELARFKLFSEQVNGGLAETCTTTFQGVPFDSLNHGARIQVGMDIIRTLQEHFGVEAPVWVDNAEAIVQLPSMECQLIRLVVSGQDKMLRIETQKEAVAA